MPGCLCVYTFPLWDSKCFYFFIPCTVPTGISLLPTVHVISKGAWPLPSQQSVQEGLYSDGVLKTARCSRSTAVLNPTNHFPALWSYHKDTGWLCRHPARLSHRKQVVLGPGSLRNVHLSTVPCPWVLHPSPLVILDGRELVVPYTHSILTPEKDDFSRCCLIAD